MIGSLIPEEFSIIHQILQLCLTNLRNVILTPTQSLFILKLFSSSVLFHEYIGQGMLLEKYQICVGML